MAVRHNGPIDTRVRIDKEVARHAIEALWRDFQPRLGFGILHVPYLFILW